MRMIFDLACSGAAAAIVLSLLSHGTVAAEGHEDPNILTIETRHGVSIAAYTREKLKQDFTMHQRETATPWSDGKAIRYRGPYLEDVLAKWGLDEGQRVEVFAFDDFVTQISMQKIENYNPILAIERACTPEDRATEMCTEGQGFVPLSMEDAGPYFIVWPIDELPEFYVPARNSIWVWFVVALRPAP